MVNHTTVYPYRAISLSRDSSDAIYRHSSSQLSPSSHQSSQNDCTQLHFLSIQSPAQRAAHSIQRDTAPLPFALAPKLRSNNAFTRKALLKSLHFLLGLPKTVRTQDPSKPSIFSRDCLEYLARRHWRRGPAAFRGSSAPEPTHARTYAPWMGLYSFSPLWYPYGSQRFQSFADRRIHHELVTQRKESTLILPQPPPSYRRLSLRKNAKQIAAKARNSRALDTALWRESHISPHGRNIGSIPTSSSFSVLDGGERGVLRTAKRH